MIIWNFFTVGNPVIFQKVYDLYVWFHFQSIWKRLRAINDARVQKRKVKFLFYNFLSLFHFKIILIFSAKFLCDIMTKSLFFFKGWPGLWCSFVRTTVGETRIVSWIKGIWRRLQKKLDWGLLFLCFFFNEVFIIELYFPFKIAFGKHSDWEITSQSPIFSWHTNIFITFSNKIDPLVYVAL